MPRLNSFSNNFFFSVSPEEGSLGERSLSPSGEKKEKKKKKKSKKKKNKKNKDGRSHSPTPEPGNKKDCMSVLEFLFLGAPPSPSFTLFTSNVKPTKLNIKPPPLLSSS